MGAQDVGFAVNQKLALTHSLKTLGENEHFSYFHTFFISVLKNNQQYMHTSLLS